jgi:hypothetical protein
MKGNTMNNQELTRALCNSTTYDELRHAIDQLDQSSAADRSAHYHVLTTVHHGPLTISPDGAPDSTIAVDAHHPHSLDGALTQTRAAIEYAHGTADVPMVGVSIFACFGECNLPGPWGLTR